MRKEEINATPEDEVEWVLSDEDKKELEKSALEMQSNASKVLVRCIVGIYCTLIRNNISDDVIKDLAIEFEDGALEEFKKNVLENNLKEINEFGGGLLRGAIAYAMMELQKDRMH